MNMMDYLEIAGVAVGLIYLYFEYKANVWVWLTGIIMPAIYIFVYYDSGFYADMGINIWYLVAGLYGWALWLGKGRRKGIVAADRGRGDAPGFERKTAACVADAGCETGNCGDATVPTVKTDAEEITQAGGKAKAELLPVTHTPVRLYLPLVLVSVAFFALISYILINFTDSTVPYGDAFTTALSITALWMMARKYAEQWIAWIVVDAVCCALYFYKELYPTALLYGLYSIIAVFGYFKWVSMIEKPKRLF